MKAHRYLLIAAVLAAFAAPANAQQAVDEGGLSIAAVNRMIAAAVRGVQARMR